MAQICKIPTSPKDAASLLGELDDLLAEKLFRALSDPTRNKLLSCLAKCGRPCSVGDIAECCHVDLSVVSRHLSILAAAGILESHKEGRTVFYVVRYEELSKVLRQLAQAFEDCHKGRSKLVSIRNSKKR
jgi:ArsR family transcriptional regulator